MTIKTHHSSSLGKEIAALADAFKRVNERLDATSPTSRVVTDN